MPLEAEQRSNGLLIRLDGEEVFLFRYPVEVGTTYEYTDVEGTNFEVSVSRESITVPAGFFECLLYTIQGPAGRDSPRVWMRPALGPVQLDLRGFDSVELISTTARSYP